MYSFSHAKTFESLYKGEAAPPVRFDRLGAVKVGAASDFMSAVVFVVPTPYFAMTDASGGSRYHDLPPGTYSRGVAESSRTALHDSLQTVEVGAAAALTFTWTSRRRALGRRHAGLRGYE